VSDAKPTGVGIIGLSASRGWAATAHLPALRSLDGFDAVAFSSSSEESARAARDAHGIELGFGDHREMVVRPEVDLVVVTVRVPAHLELVSAAIDAGKDVFCEWPLALDLDEAERMRDAAAAAGVRAFVGLQARSLPSLRFLADYVAAGEIGEVLSTTVVGSGDRWGAEVPADVAYLIDRGSGATMLTIPVGHSLDGIFSVLGEPAELSAVTAVRRPTVALAGSNERVPMTAEDQVAIVGRLQSGAVLSLHYRGGRSPGTNFLWEIEGTEGTVVLEGGSGHLQYGKVALSVGPVGGGERRPLEVPDGYEAPGPERGTLPYAVGQAYARMREALAGGDPGVPTFADAVVRHRTLAAIESSARSGRTERLD
jgi:predicted dehydrogenase